MSEACHGQAADRVWLVGLLLVGVSTACTRTDGVSADTDAPAGFRYSDPSQPGPYPVGVSTILLPSVADYTDVPTEVWYPAARALNLKTDYDLLGVAFPADAYRDAPAAQDAILRVIAFSHGLGGVRQQNYAMAERLASFGFVVVAPDHTGTTTLDYLAGLRDVGPSIVRRPTAIRVAVDAVIGGAVPTLNVEDGGYAMIGHSLGSLTAMTVGGGRPSEADYTATCASEAPPEACDVLGDVDFDPDDLMAYAQPDPRVVTTVLQSPGAPYAFVAGSLAAIPHPLVMAGTADTLLEYTAEAVPVYAELAGPAALASFQGAGHYGFTNMCVLSVATLFAKDCEGAAAGFPDPVVVRDQATTMVVAWVGATLGGEDAFLEDLGATATVDWETK